MTDVSHPFRCLAAVVAVLVGLTWSVPVGQAACLSAEHCGGSMPAEDCVGGESSPSVACLTHHASQEAVEAKEPSVDPVTGAVRGGTPSISTPRTFSSLRLGSRHTPRRAVRRHARVGVWLE